MNMTTEEMNEILAARGQMLAKDGRTIIPRTKNPVLANAMEGASPKKKSKYGNRKVWIDGIPFDSQKEGNRYIVHRDNMSAGKYWFVRQVKFDLGGGVIYVCDFMIVHPDNRIEIEDVKGFKTQVYRNKKKQAEARYPIKVEEI
jgi:hypothetical protein